MKNQQNQRKKSIEGKLRTIAEILELILNYLVLICVLTAAAAILHMLESPFWYLLIPAGLPVYYWYLRKNIMHAGWFFMLHIPAALLIGAAGFFLKQNRIFWIVMLIASVLAYTVNSIVVRVKEKKQESLPAGMALGIAVVAFFGCAYVDAQKGCTRILVCSLIYVFFLFLRLYLLCMSEYLLTNKNAAGAMPEQAIVQLSMRNVLVQSAAAVAALAVLIWSPAAEWMTQQAKKAGLLILKGIAWLISLLASTDPEQDIPLEEAMPDLSSGMTAFAGAVEETPWWLKLLEQLFYLLGIGLGAAFVGALIVMLVKRMIEGFYENKQIKKEVFVEGFLEEEERIGKNKESRQVKLPVLGGTLQQKVRRTFWKAVTAEYEKLGEQKPDPSQTARQFAQRFAGEKSAEWNELAALYEKARYADGEVTREDVRQVAALAKRIRR